jgi:hypothetical protein
MFSLLKITDEYRSKQQQAEEYGGNGTHHTQAQLAPSPEGQGCSRVLD